MGSLCPRRRVGFLHPAVPGFVVSSKYFKKYTGGELAGQQVELTSAEFQELRDEAAALWGTTDWKGGFVPGLLLRELPVININPDLAARHGNNAGS